MAGSAGIIKPGLQRISRLLQYLGNPENSYDSLQIAGTNGKGSTAYFLSNMLTKSELTVGLFTSPHILLPEERIKVSNRAYQGNLLEDVRELEKSYRRGQGKRVRDRPTFFELTTAVALDYFKANNVDFAILETGLGGKLDATTVVPSVGEILTDISPDHQEFLGNSLEEILHEKLGVVKGKFLVSCSLPQYFSHLVEIVCEEKGCRARFLGRDFFYEKTREGMFHYLSDSDLIGDLSLGTAGGFQFRNASIAIAAMLQLKDVLAIDKNNIFSFIREGLAETRIEGRCQKISSRPDVIIDVGHNALSAHVLKEEVRRRRFHSNGNVVCVFTMMKTRNPAPFLMSLREVIDLFIFFPCGKRYLEVETIERMDVKNIVPLEVAVDFSSAYTIAHEKTDTDGLILMTGSFALAELYHKLMK